MEKENYHENGKIKWTTLMVSLFLVVLIAMLSVCVVWLIVQENESRTFYEGTTLNGVEVSGLTAQETEQKLTEAVERYQLTVRFADRREIIKGSTIALHLNEENQIKELIREQNKLSEEELSTTDLALQEEELFVYDVDALKAEVSEWDELTALAEVMPQNAELVYSEMMGRFYSTEGVVGGAINSDRLTACIEEKLETLTNKLNVVEAGLYGGRSIRLKESTEMQNALRKANEQLNLELVYHYSVPQVELYGTEKIDYEELSQWLYVEKDGVTIGVKADMLQNYVNEMCEIYSVHDGTTSQFVTSTGDYVEVDVPASDETVDGDALYNDIEECIRQVRGGDRNAPYAQTSGGIAGTTDLGGNYVEVDLDSQYLWLYQNKTVIAEGSICSGDLATGCATPSGLYTIKNKETDRWLNGEGYHDWVSYWMPFNGGIGLHDATWRTADEFGGEVYLENGSHGCINMPLDLAAKVYEAMDIGGYVILYGGHESEKELIQTVIGTSEYHKRVGDGSFYLDSRSTGDGSLTFASSNTRVATVDEYGKVSVVGEGTAFIKVTAQATTTYERTTKTVLIKVDGASLSDAESEDF